MKIENNSFTLSGNELEHSQKYFDELMAIIELVRHSDKELSAIDFKLKISIKSVKDWDEMAIESNLYFLEKIKLLDIERTNEFPRKYKIKINEPSVTSFVRMAENKFLLESDFSEKDFLKFIIEIRERVYNNLHDTMIDYWRNTIASKYSSTERKKMLIIERDKQIKQFDSHNNLLKFYDITNLENLSKKLIKAVLYKEKIPFSPHPLIGLINSIKKLEYTLELRFNNWYRIQTLNELIGNENDELNGQKEDYSKSKALTNALDNENIEEIIKVFNTNIANIPYDHLKGDSEGFYNAILNVILQNNISTEEFIDQKHNNIGRSDIIIFRPKHIYCIELKINKTAKEALEQIFEKRYLEPYKLEGKTLIAMGINISTINKRIDDYAVEKLLE